MEDVIPCNSIKNNNNNNKDQASYNHIIKTNLQQGVLQKIMIKK